MANKNPPIKINEEDNKRLRMYPVPIKCNYYDKYPEAMEMLESSAYGKNEVILQALQYVYDCFSIKVINRETVKALSAAMGYDKNGNKIERKAKRRKKNETFSSNLRPKSTSSSQSLKESNKPVQSQPEASNESKKVEPVKEENKDVKQIQKNDYDKQQKLKAEQEAQARKRAEAEAEAKRRTEEEAMKTQRPEAEVENGEDDYMTFEPDMSFFTPPKELVPEEPEKPVVPQRPQRDPNKFKVF